MVQILLTACNYVNSHFAQSWKYNEYTVCTFQRVVYEFLSWPFKHLHCSGFHRLCSTREYGLNLGSECNFSFAQLNISVNYTSLIARFKPGLMALHWGLPHDAIFDQHFAKMTLLSQSSSYLRLHMCCVSSTQHLCSTVHLPVTWVWNALKVVGTCNPRCLPGLDFSVDTFPCSVRAVRALETWD